MNNHLDEFDPKALEELQQNNCLTAEELAVTSFVCSAKAVVLRISMPSSKSCFIRISGKSDSHSSKWKRFEGSDDRK
jgi:hypothetical protein